MSRKYWLALILQEIHDDETDNLWDDAHCWDTETISHRYGIDKEKSQILYDVLRVLTG